MTKEEYQIKIKELRKERDLYNSKARKLDEEMDALQIDQKYNEVLKGEYVLFDSSPVGYKIYFHVDRWESRPRGCYVYGKGFYITSYGLQITQSNSIIYEDDLSNCKYSIITKEEFDKAFEDVIIQFREMFETADAPETFTCKTGTLKFHKIKWS